MEETLKEILSKLSTMQTDITSMQTDIASMQTDIASMQTDITSMQTDMATMQTDIADTKQVMAQGFAQTNIRLDRLEAGQLRMEKKVDTIMTQVAGNTEEHTRTDEKLGKIEDAVEYLVSKQAHNEREIFSMKRRYTDKV